MPNSTIADTSERTQQSSGLAASDAEHDVSSGIRGLVLVARFHGITMDPESLASECAIGAQPTTIDSLMRVADAAGLRLKKLTGGAPLLARIRRPVLLLRTDGQYIVVGPPVQGGQFPIFDPTTHGPGIRPPHMETHELCDVWSGQLFTVVQPESSGSPESSYGFRFFLPSVWRYRWPLVQVLIASCFIQLFALVTPLFFQIIIDKVLLHKSTSTLLVVTIGMVVLGLFDVTLQYLRAYALAHTTNRLDVELGGRLFRHLLKLPIAYFETRPAGQTVARVRELETIRSFLTGQGLTACIDLLFTALFLAVLFVYSIHLTLIVIATIPLYLGVAGLVRPILREKVRERFNKGAESQQFLVESVIGAQTLKAAAIESLVERQWVERMAAYVKTSFQAMMVASIGQNGIQYLNKLTTALLLYFGAEEVIDGTMTVGALVAFNMIAAQVFVPIMRLSQLWQDFQQILVSIERLGDIFKATPEPQPSTRSRPQRLAGSICLQDVHFRYHAGGREVLRGISLEIPAGQVIGIVGPSGSGKSTLTKLIQRFYMPEHGRITIDGVDIDQLPAPWLRRQMGIVLQDNLLFNRTVRENIALANPLMDHERIVDVAKLAGAHEFICELPNRYDYQIVERGANFSGGQRQRIAIARALARNPRILIFDEATSALDYESERIIRQNMKEMARGRTVIIIAHRLAAVRHCHRIVGLAGGQIVEQGSHDELLAKSGSLYGHLWFLQSSGSVDEIAK
jgi:ATP-binding cassette, subfamily B, bacterial HlyB/CyaB